MAQHLLVAADQYQLTRLRRWGTMKESLVAGCSWGQGCPVPRGPQYQACACFDKAPNKVSLPLATCRICERRLCETVDVETVATTLTLAEQVCSELVCGWKVGACDAILREACFGWSCTSTACPVLHIPWPICLFNAPSCPEPRGGAEARVPGLCEPQPRGSHGHRGLQVGAARAACVRGVRDADLWGAMVSSGRGPVCIFQPLFSTCLAALEPFTAQHVSPRICSSLAKLSLGLPISAGT